MAPLPPPPSARSLRLQRITGQIHHLAPDKTFRTGAATTDAFLESKRDKRLIKHSSFVSRIATASSRVSKSRKPSSRRRASAANSSSSSSKLTTLDSLADALPELVDGEGGAEVLDGKVRHKSLKSKKGALRRKEKIVRGEMERFGVSMAKLTGTPGQQQQPQQQPQQQQGVEMDQSGESASAAAPAATANRWAALRGYISASMEQNPAFANKQ